LSLSADGVATQGSTLFAFRVETSDRTWSAAALIEPRVFARAIDLAPAPGETAALMSRGRQILAVAGAPSSDTNWLPADALVVGPNYEVATARSQSGAVFSYATQPVLGPDFFILKRFSSSAGTATQLRFLALALAPVLLAALGFAYAGALQSELLRGVGAIRAAMRTMNADGAVGLAPEVGTQKTLREFAADYNEMAREAASRAQSLRMSLAENEFLLRELNHRVKSSLQIIQSYVSLTRPRIRSANQRRDDRSACPGAFDRLPKGFFGGANARRPDPSIRRGDRRQFLAAARVVGIGD
jgi:signal transduction histidine kinase